MATLTEAEIDEIIDEIELYNALIKTTNKSIKDLEKLPKNDENDEEIDLYNALIKTTKKSMKDLNIKLPEDKKIQLEDESKGSSSSSVSGTPKAPLPQSIKEKHLKLLEQCGFITDSKTTSK